MGKFSGILLASDMDGTLTDSHGRISDENAGAIRYFQSEGGLFTVSTGRFPDFIESFRESVVPNTFVIGLNGTVLYDRVSNADIISHPMKSSSANDIISIIKACPETDSLHIACRRESHAFMRSDFDRLDELLSAIDEPWYKAIFCQNHSDTLIVRERVISLFCNEYSVDLSWGEGVEFHSIDSGKGSMVLELASYLNGHGHSIYKTVCVGDYENDISMIKCADIGYAVANATDEVKAVADRITVNHNESAIAHIISELESEL